MRKIFYLIMICFVLLSSCTKKSIDVLKLSTIEEDSTISIVATGDLIWNPLGDLSTLQASNRNILKIADSVEIDSLNEKMKIRKFIFGTSFIRVASFRNQNYLLQADIRDPEIRFSCDIKVGMVKLDFFKLFMDDPELNSLKQYIVVKMSDPLGESISETFIFKENQLNAISIKTEEYLLKKY